MRKFLLLLVLCLGSVGATFAQIKISGKVVDAETGQPLIGATVMIGTTTGVATLADGTYVLPVPASAGEHPVLTFTYIGYESLNVTVGKNHVVNAKLKPEVVIDQIVVTGFKNAKKESFTGSSVKISADDVAIAGVTDVSRMLEGQVAGVSVQNVSSTFGSAPKVRIRGVTSLSGENKPLWVQRPVVVGRPDDAAGFVGGGHQRLGHRDLRHPERRLGNGPLRCPRHERRGGHHY